MRSTTILAVIVVAGIVSGARAAFTAPPWARPADATQAADDLTTYQEWNVFSAAGGPNVPDGGNVNPNGDADVYETTGAGFITSSGNIYSFSSILEMQGDIPGFNLGAGYATRFVVQLRTLGTTVDIDSLALDSTPVNTLGDYSYTELDRIALGGEFGGDLIDHRWTFTAPSSNTTYQLTWTPAGSSSSQDIVIVDTQTVAVSAALPGDADGDGDVDADDLHVVTTNFGQPVTSGAAEGDFDGDGVVTLDDYSIAALNFGASGDESPALVPEPAAALLLITAATLAHRTGRRP
jgi:hypothetical protein